MQFLFLRKDEILVLHRRLIELFLKIAAGELTRSDVEQQFLVWLIRK